MRTAVAVITILGILTIPVSVIAGELSDPSAAPEWAISEWINGDPGTLDDLRGKVVMIEFFQLWCPGCNRFSIPLFKRWNDSYAGRSDVAVVSIHSVFEGHASQGPDRLKGFVDSTGIDHPVGIDAYPEDGGDTPITMERFRTGGTPHVVIVDRAGRIRFSQFGVFDPTPVEALIDRLLAEPAR